MHREVDKWALGAGDLLTALLLAQLDKQPRNLKAAVEVAISSLQAVLQATVKAAGESAFAKERDARVIGASFLLRFQTLRGNEGSFAAEPEAVACARQEHNLCTYGEMKGAVALAGGKGSRAKADREPAPAEGCASAAACRTYSLSLKIHWEFV